MSRNVSNEPNNKKRRYRDLENNINQPVDLIVGKRTKYKNSFCQNYNYFDLLTIKSRNCNPEQSSISTIDSGSSQTIITPLMRTKISTPRPLTTGACTKKPGTVIKAQTKHVYSLSEFSIKERPGSEISRTNFKKKV